MFNEKIMCDFCIGISTISSIQPKCSVRMGCGWIAIRKSILQMHSLLMRCCSTSRHSWVPRFSKDGAHVERTKLPPNTFHVLSSYLICRRTSTSMMMMKANNTKMCIINSEIRVHITSTWHFRLRAASWPSHVLLFHGSSSILFVFIFEKIFFFLGISTKTRTVRCHPFVHVLICTRWFCGAKKVPGNLFIRFFRFFSFLFLFLRC